MKAYKQKTMQTANKNHLILWEKEEIANQEFHGFSQQLMMQGILLLKRNSQGETADCSFNVGDH